MEKEQDKKKILMKVGIISVMVLVAVLWILNLKNVFRGNEAAVDNQDTAQWQKLKDDFNEAADKIVSPSITATSSIVATSSPEAVPPIATSSPKASQDCPAYIDCMPTIGEAKPCIIPVGCENITQIAY